MSFRLTLCTKLRTARQLFKKKNGEDLKKVSLEQGKQSDGQEQGTAKQRESKEFCSPLITAHPHIQATAALSIHPVREPSLPSHVS